MERKKVMEKKKGNFATTLGYGLGSMVRVGENLWGFYLSYFLVTVVGISAATAGTISGAALLIASIACLFIGYISDSSKSKYGKRRPMMLVSIFPTAILMSLIFIKVDFGGATTVYYSIVCILFYVMYYVFLVPYDSLGAELTVDYNSRTKIRSLCTVILYVSVFLGGTLVMYVQIWIANAGVGGEAGSWSLAVLIACTLPMLICGLLAWRVTRGKEPVNESAETEAPKENILKSYLTVLKVKPFVAIALWSLLYFIGNTIIAGMLVYFGVYACGLDETMASTAFTISMVVTIVMAAPANWLSGKLGKKNALMLAMLVYAVIGVAVFIKGPTGYVDVVLVSAGYGITNSIALICSYSMVYDVGELNMFKFGDDKTAAAIGTYTLGMGLAQAIGYSLIGYILQWAGFDAAAAEQSESVINYITVSETVVPIAFMAVSALIVAVFYRINPKNHAALVEALEAKKNGEEYSTDGFKELL